MTKILLAALFTLSALNLGCDAPVRDRRGSYKNRNGLINPNWSGYGNPSSGASVDDEDIDKEETSPDDQVDTGNGTQQVPSEISHCNWSLDGVTGHQSYHAHLGAYTFCQSSQNEKDVWIQLKTPVTDSTVCIIPTTHVDNKSTFVGEPRCLYINQATKAFKVSLIKNRYGYESANITGAMIMKDKVYNYPPPIGGPYGGPYYAPDAYLVCMTNLERGFPQYCQSFQQVQQYVYHQFN